MSWWLVLSGSIALILLLLLLGIPIFVSFLMLNVAGLLLLLGPAGFGMITNSIYTTSTLGALSAVPLFILMGELLFRSGAMEVLFDSLDRLIGGVRGRQYVLCIILSAIIGALSGAAMAVAGLLGRSLFPTMRKRGYDLHMSTGTHPRRRKPRSHHSAQRAGDHHRHAGGGIDRQDADRRRHSGSPAVGNVHRLRSHSGVLRPEARARCRRRSSRSRHARQRLHGARPDAAVRFIFFLVMGLIMLGVATPTEAAATGVFGSLVLAWFYGGLSWRMLVEALHSGVTVAALLLLIMACATMFSQLLAFTGATRELGDFVAHQNLSGPLMLLIMMGAPFVCSCSSTRSR